MEKFGASCLDCVSSYGFFPLPDGCVLVHVITRATANSKKHMQKANQAKPGAVDLALGPAEDLVEEELQLVAPVRLTVLYQHILLI